MLAAGVPLHTVSELLGHSPVAFTGDMHCPVVNQARAPPSSDSQQQWAGENVCRCYTNGNTAAKRPPRILSETASDAMKERGLLPLPAAPPSGMLGSVQVPCERARRPLNGSVCG